MRRIPAMAAVAIVLLPIMLATTTASAATATGTLTVQTYDRAGKKTASQLRIINLSTRVSYTARSFTARKLKKGKYAVITDIWSAKEGSNTLGARVLKVSGKTTTTIDARRGRPIKVALDRGPGAQYRPSVRAAICSDRASADIELDTWNEAGKVYVIPNGSKRLRFAYSQSWEGAAEHKLWMVNGATKTGVPAGVTRTVKASSLATITAYVRRGPAGSDQASVRLVDRLSCRPGYGTQAMSDPAPGIATIHALAGKWTLEADWFATGKDGSALHIGFDRRNLTLAAGKSYRQTFFASVWGPAINLPHTWNKRLQFDTSQMFTDPVSNSQSEGSQRALVTLYNSKGKALKKQWRQNYGNERSPHFSYKLRKAGWYRLQVDSRRYRPDIVGYPADMLSPKAQAIFRWKADPKNKPRYADVYLPRLYPAGLDLNNRAKAGGTTVVQIRPDRQSILADVKLPKVGIKTVIVHASYDGGKTWRSAAVRKVGGKWQATVRNPAGGAVTLRSRITSTTGAYAQVTVVRAYTVG